MTEFIIRWNAGYGDCYDIADVENEKEAQEYAYESWKDDIENSADYEVIGKATEELKEEYDL